MDRRFPSIGAMPSVLRSIHTPMSGWGPLTADVTERPRDIRKVLGAQPMRLSDQSWPGNLQAAFIAGLFAPRPRLLPWFRPDSVPQPVMGSSAIAGSATPTVHLLMPPRGPRQEMRAAD